MAGFRTIAILTIFSAIISCGGEGADYYDDVVTGSPPVVTRMDPAQGAAGTQVTIFGLGFSYISPTNIVTMGSVGAAAEDYTVLQNQTAAEIETITFTVPADLAPGEYPVVVVVHDTASNSNVTFTVTQ